MKLQITQRFKQVHVDGVLAGERIGGLLAKADQSSIWEKVFKGRIINTYETTAATISVVWSVIWQETELHWLSQKRQ